MKRTTHTNFNQHGYCWPLAILTTSPLDELLPKAQQRRADDWLTQLTAQRPDPEQLRQLCMTRGRMQTHFSTISLN